MQIIPLRPYGTLQTGQFDADFMDVKMHELGQRKTTTKGEKINQYETLALKRKNNRIEKVPYLQNT